MRVRYAVVDRNGRIVRLVSCIEDDLPGIRTGPDEGIFGIDVATFEQLSVTSAQQFTERSWNVIDRKVKFNLRFEGAALRSAGGTNFIAEREDSTAILISHDAPEAVTLWIDNTPILGEQMGKVAPGEQIKFMLDREGMLRFWCLDEKYHCPDLYLNIKPAVPKDA